MKVIRTLLVLSLFPVLSSANDTAQAIAKNYGIENWDKVESITYTFNVKNPRREMARTWTWQPTEDIVYSHKDNKTYNRNESIDEAIDRGFINDVFWLLFPFQIVWDPTLKFEEEKYIKDPISGKTVDLLRVIYNQEDGYTPGDVYELYYDKDYNILAWAFIKGGNAEPRPMSWEGNKTINGITISTEHNSLTGTRLWFSDIEVKVK